MPQSTAVLISTLLEERVPEIRSRLTRSGVVVNEALTLDLPRQRIVALLAACNAAVPDIATAGTFSVNDALTPVHALICTHPDPRADAVGRVRDALPGLRAAFPARSVLPADVTTTIYRTAVVEPCIHAPATATDASHLLDVIAKYRGFAAAAASRAAATSLADSTRLPAGAAGGSTATLPATPLHAAAAAIGTQAVAPAAGSGTVATVSPRAHHYGLVSTSGDGPAAAAAADDDDGDYRPRRSVPVPYNPYTGETSKAAHDAVLLDELYSFVFPPGQRHPRSTGRLILYALHGPLSVDGRLLGGRGVGRVLTDREINAMIADIEREDVLGVRSGGACARSAACASSNAAWTLLTGCLLPLSHMPTGLHGRLRAVRHAGRHDRDPRRVADAAGHVARASGGDAGGPAARRGWAVLLPRHPSAGVGCAVQAGGGWQAHEPRTDAGRRRAGAAAADHPWP